MYRDVAWLKQFNMPCLEVVKNVEAVSVLKGGSLVDTTPHVDSAVKWNIIQPSAYLKLLQIMMFYG